VIVGVDHMAQWSVPGMSALASIFYAIQTLSGRK
jgi:hypothetical protein